MHAARTPLAHSRAISAPETSGRAFTRRAATLHEDEGDGPVRVDPLEEFQQQRNAALEEQEPPEVRKRNVRMTAFVAVAAAVAAILI